MMHTSKRVTIQRSRRGVRAIHPDTTARGTSGNLFRGTENAPDLRCDSPVRHIESMVLERRAPYPIERTLLTSGMPLTAVESLPRAEGIGSGPI